MKTHLLLIRTISPDSTPSPKPSLIADLVDAVLKVPGLRVASVEVNLIAESEAITRRVRNLKSVNEAGTSEPEPHAFIAGVSGIHCKVCGQMEFSNKHVAATAKPGKETIPWSTMKDVPHRFMGSGESGLCDLCGQTLAKHTAI